MAQIPLTQGKVAVVDDADAALVAGRTWRAVRVADRWYVATGHATYMHRLILGLADGDRREADHADRDGLNNRRSNLRVASKSQNAGNARPRPKYAGHAPSSRFKGVCLHRPTGRWMASIRSNGQTQYLGYFVDEEDAARAYDDAALRLFGEFARVNGVGRQED